MKLGQNIFSFDKSAEFEMVMVRRKTWPPEAQGRFPYMALVKSC